MFDFLGEIIGDLVLDLVLMLFTELATELVKAIADACSILREESVGQRTRPWLHGVGFLAVGAAIGLGSLLLFPGRVVRGGHAVPGVSLALAPLAAGLAMHFFGKLCRDVGGHPSPLATFWGGALFGFGAALVRFLMVGR